jgi:LPXTG-motif cell wall-anchored protein
MTSTAAGPAAPIPGSTATAAATAATAAENLAQTGSARSMGLLASVGASFLLAGATVAVLRRGRRGRGAHAR